MRWRSLSIVPVSASQQYRSMLDTGTIGHNFDNGTGIVGSSRWSCEAILPALCRQHALFNQHYREIPSVVDTQLFEFHHLKVYFPRTR